ncbi:hypothetical protein CW740_01020 [Kangiella profundi]|uniref:Uncharacterized protein n=1 Tax=Kangiella profundi TaxID=1561924 RepID=A0A2K9ARV8_9GAMM|nr:hypothetical protein [Kangiella profundi]AUD77891.1 hypothetical protein CW740_01020 [Kangiella profundi]GGE91671.1 hypothetical protein GCM10011356_02230 [Kangiella profundi]
MRKNLRLPSLIRSIAAITLLITLSTGCDQNSNQQAEMKKKWLNPNIVEHFEKLGENYSNTRLKLYSPIKFKNNDERYLQNCMEIDATPINSVIETEVDLLLAAKLDCAIARQFIHAKPATSSYLPNPLTTDYLKQFPANVIPSFNEQQERNAERKTLGELNINENNTVQDHVFEILLNDVLSVKITEIARADFNADGMEELMIMTEWVVKDSGDGEGVDLLVIEGKEHKPKIIWRFIDQIDWQ